MGINFDKGDPSLNRHLSANAGAKNIQISSMPGQKPLSAQQIKRIQQVIKACVENNGTVKDVVEDIGKELGSFGWDSFDVTFQDSNSRNVTVRFENGLLWNEQATIVEERFGATWASATKTTLGLPFTSPTEALQFEQWVLSGDVDNALLVQNGDNIEIQIRDPLYNGSSAYKLLGTFKFPNTPDHWKSINAIAQRMGQGRKTEPPFLVQARVLTAINTKSLAGYNFNMKVVDAHDAASQQKFLDAIEQLEKDIKFLMMSDYAPNMPKDFISQAKQSLLALKMPVKEINQFLSRVFTTIYQECRKVRDQNQRIADLPADGTLGSADPYGTCADTAKQYDSLMNSLMATAGKNGIYVDTSATPPPSIGDIFKGLLDGIAKPWTGKKMSVEVANVWLKDYGGTTLFEYVASQNLEQFESLGDQGDKFRDLVTKYETGSKQHKIMDDLLRKGGPGITVRAIEFLAPEPVTGGKQQTTTFAFYQGVDSKGQTVLIDPSSGDSYEGKDLAEAIDHYMKDGPLPAGSRIAYLDEGGALVQKDVTYSGAMRFKDGLQFILSVAGIATMFIPEGGVLISLGCFGLSTAIEGGSMVYKLADGRKVSAEEWANFAVQSVLIVGGLGKGLSLAGKTAQEMRLIAKSTRLQIFTKMEQIGMGAMTLNITDQLIEGLGKGDLNNLMSAFMNIALMAAAGKVNAMYRSKASSKTLVTEYKKVLDNITPDMHSRVFGRETYYSTFKDYAAANKGATLKKYVDYLKAKSDRFSSIASADSTTVIRDITLKTTTVKGLKLTPGREQVFAERNGQFIEQRSISSDKPMNDTIRTKDAQDAFKRGECVTGDDFALIPRKSGQPDPIHTHELAVTKKQLDSYSGRTITGKSPEIVQLMKDIRGTTDDFMSGLKVGDKGRVKILCTTADKQTVLLDMSYTVNENGLALNNIRTVPATFVVFRQASKADSSDISMDMESQLIQTYGKNKGVYVYKTPERGVYHISFSDPGACTSALQQYRSQYGAQNVFSKGAKDFEVFSTVVERGAPMPESGLVELPPGVTYDQATGVYTVKDLNTGRVLRRSADAPDLVKDFMSRKRAEYVKQGTVFDGWVPDYKGAAYSPAQ